MSSEPLRDAHGRVFHYLRLSVTEACNFHCQYCLPDGYRSEPGQELPLSVDEIRRLVSAFSEMGFWKVRLTGGEPTTRRDLVEIAREVARVPGITKVSLTTNGARFPALAKSLRDAGVKSVNISVDSLDRGCFAEITGHDRLAEVLRGVDLALELGFDPVKINTVLLRGLNDGELASFMNFVRERPISVRFIELMETDGSAEFFKEHHVSPAEMQEKLVREGWEPSSRAPDSGPAVEYSHSGHLGRIGVIAPYASGFCGTCNRLRVSSRGAMRLCLFGEQDFSFRKFLQSDDQKGELISVIRGLMARKPVSHFLHEGKHGKNSSLSAIGG